MNILNYFKKDSPEAQKNLNKQIMPQAVSRIKQDTLSWREACAEMERGYFPHRVLVQEMYLDTLLNGHVLSCIEKRKDLVLLKEWGFKDDEENKLKDIINKKWFTDFLSYALDSMYFGYSLIALGDIENNQFTKIQPIKRNYISPDRLTVAGTRYALDGVKFLEEPYLDWHVWIPTNNNLATTDCGYGLLYNVAIYEIFLRNVLGYNGDFVELFSQPYRIGRTNKTEEAERAEFTDAVANMGSSGYAILDAIDDDIQFLESSLGNNGYEGYADFEHRLEQKISKIILGHADALDSTSGKIGASQGEDSPVYKALQDKEQKDCKFMENVVNTILLPKLRKLGFKIPETAVFEFKNNHEKHEHNENFTALAVEIKKAGLQVDKDYFEEQTGIKLSEPEQSNPTITKSIKNKLNELYR